MSHALLDITGGYRSPSGHRQQGNRQAERARGALRSEAAWSERVRRWQGSNVLKRLCVWECARRGSGRAEPSGVWLREGRQKRGAETKGA